MPRTIPESAREHADLALAVYVEELAARRRVLFVGDAASAVPERLSSVARSVEVVSPRTRARGTRRGGRILPRPWPSQQDARSWDLVLVPDLLWAGPPSAERVAEMAEWLTPRGVLVVGAEDREDGIGYEALYDLLARRFDWVRMLGEAPFAGWSVVDFAPASRELEVTFDGSLLGGTGEEPARYLALCAEREVVLDPYAIVQVPAGRDAVARAAAAAPAERAARDDGQAHARISQLEVQLRDRQDEVERASARGDELERELTAVRARVEHAERRVEQAQREIARGAQKLDEARARADALTRELEETHEELASLRERPEHEPGEDELANGDYGRLESALAERGRELTELRLEVERRGTLVRDLVEELTEARGGAAAIVAPPAPGGGGGGGGGGGDEARALREAIESARRRAVEAEAAVAEAGFRLDQVRGELAVCKRGRETDREHAAREIAFAHGTVRGLSARLAETDELRQLAEARLALAHDDVAGVRGRVRELERDLEEAREQVALALMRAKGDPRAAAPAARTEDHAPEGHAPEGADAVRGIEARLRAVESEASEREGRLYGALLSARESAAEKESERRRLARELARAEESARAAREEAARTESRFGELADEATRALAEAEARGREAASLRASIEARATELSTLRGERAGLELRLADAEAAVGAARARAAALEGRLAGEAAPSGPSPAEVAELADLRQRVEVLGASVNVWTQRAEEAAARAQAESDRAADLGVRLSTRDALIARVQSEVAQSVARQDELERRVRERDATILELREALESARAVADVRADEDRRDKRDLESRIAEARRERERAAREHDETRAALTEARAILAQIATGLDAPPGSAPAVPVSDARLREQLRQLQRDADDRELMLRSLTAQLQDRDDRLRALERMKAGEGVSGEEPELVQRVLLAEERTARLERELEQERLARRQAEQSGSGAEQSAELRRMSQLLGDRDAQLMVLEGRITQSEREQRTMRDAFAQARGGLETLLGEIANDQRAEAADRIANMLRLLRRY